jgi:hypothetical protein
MIKLFQTNRKNLLMDNKTSKYFKYAIGEIILVVIGILIAIQVSNLNQIRVETNTMTSYYEKLVNELSDEIVIIEKQREGIKELIQLQKRCLEIIKANDKTKIPELSESLGAVGTAWKNKYSFEIFNEFIAQGYLSKITDPELKQQLLNVSLVLVNSKIEDSYIQDQYNTIIEPFFNKTINYSEVALKRYKDGLVQGGPKTNFINLFNNLEVWNVITLKLETTNSNLKRVNEALFELSKLKTTLEQKLFNS